MDFVPFFTIQPLQDLEPGQLADFSGVEWFFFDRENRNFTLVCAEHESTVGGWVGCADTDSYLDQ